MVLQQRVLKHPPLSDLVASWICPQSQVVLVKFVCTDHFAQFKDQETINYKIEVPGLVRNRSRDIIWFVGQEHTTLGPRCAIAGKIHLNAHGRQHKGTMFVPYGEAKLEELIEELTKAFNSPPSPSHKVDVAITILTELSNAVAEVANFS